MSARWCLPLLLWSCAQGEPIDWTDVHLISVDEPADEATPKAEAPAPEHGPACGADFKVSAELLPAAQAQGARWAAATGCPVTFSEAGIPVTLEQELFNDEGTEVWGATHVKTRGGVFTRCVSVQVSRAATAPELTLGHELGHCLGAARGGTDGAGHTEYGIMKAWHDPESDYRLNAEALELVCSSVPCRAFNPE